MLYQKSNGSVGKQADEAKISLPWRWSQYWRDVLFIHWQMPRNKVLSHLPEGLELDTWESSAWITAVAFRLDIKLRGLPSFTSFSNLVELNLRTYVRRNGIPAVYFLGIQANSRTAVTLARWLTPLPYSFARIIYDDETKDAQFVCHNSTGTAERPLLLAEFKHRAAGDEVVVGSLDDWLLERYCAYVSDKSGRLFYMEVEHPRWQIEEVSLEVMTQGLGERWGFDLGRKPDRWHFSSGVHAFVWPFNKVRAPSQ
jgi:uncharacterized protein